MADFPGAEQTSRVIDRLRSELVRTVLEAPRPRVFDDDHLPTGGGYGLTIPTENAPETWKDLSQDSLCPVLEHWQWTNVENGASIGTIGIDPFEPEELSDRTPSGTVLFGNGLMLVEVEDRALSAIGEQNLGREVPVHVDTEVRIEIRVPNNRGSGQLNLYAGLLARVLTAQIIQTADGPPADALDFGWVPESARIVGVNGDWLVGSYSAQAKHIYRIPFVRAA